MAEQADENSGTGRAMMWIALAALGIVFTIFFIAGFVAQHQDSGGGAFSGAATGIFVAAGAIILGLSYAIWRNVRKFKSGGDSLTRRERLNRNIMASCFAVGVAMGIFFTIGDGAGDLGEIWLLNDAPLAPAIALPFVFFWAILMPVIGWWWHTRAIDEQEANAYRDGAFVAGYAYLIGAPTWWMLWRGGFVGEPNGVIIFFAFALIWSGLWFWKKYR